MRSTVRWCCGTCVGRFGVVRISEPIIPCTIDACKRQIEEATAMRATVYNGPHSIEVVEWPDPVLTAPTDAVVRVVPGSVSGSDLRYYRRAPMMALPSQPVARLLHRGRHRAARFVHRRLQPVSQASWRQRGMEA